MKLLLIFPAWCSTFGVFKNVARKVSSFPPLNFCYVASIAEKSHWEVEIIDATFEICGAAQSISYELMLETGKPVKALGLEDRSVGVSYESRNATPSSERIIATVKELMR